VVTVIGASEAVTVILAVTVISDGVIVAHVADAVIVSITVVPETVV